MKEDNKNYNEARYRKIIQVSAQLMKSQTV
jgi:hypothetical protein